jgi:ribosomal silencing factor RsfS
MESQKNGKKIVDLNIKGDKKLIDTKITYENISNEDINIINKHITPKEKNFGINAQ